MAAGAGRQPLFPTDQHGRRMLLLPVAANFEMQCFKNFIFFPTMTHID